MEHHRHSGSKTASIRIVQDDEAIRKSGRKVRDARRMAVRNSIQSSGVGIQGMRERISITGTMSIESDGSAPHARRIGEKVAGKNGPSRTLQRG